VEEVMRIGYNRELKLEIGREALISNGVNICESNRVDKLSAHVKINVKFTNLHMLREFVRLLEVYINSNRTTDEEREYLMFYKISKGGKREYKPIFDVSVYTNFSHFRQVYSSKWKEGG
jgi:hypothetical protein